VDWELFQEVWLQWLVVQVLLLEQPQWDECSDGTQERNWDSVGEDQSQLHHHQHQEGRLRILSLDR